MSFVANYKIEDLIADWNPSKTPHCSNCRSCVVFGEPDAPFVRCASGHGEGSKSIWAIARKVRPFGFRRATDCPGWESMDDDDL